MKKAIFRWLHILAACIYLWAAYFIGASLYLNLRLPKTMRLRDMTVQRGSLWTPLPGRIYLRNVRLLYHKGKQNKITMDLVCLKFNLFAHLHTPFVIRELHIDGGTIASYVEDKSIFSHISLLPEKDPDAPLEKRVIPGLKRHIAVNAFVFNNVRVLELGNYRLQGSLCLRGRAAIQRHLYLTGLAADIERCSLHYARYPKPIARDLRGSLRITPNRFTPVDDLFTAKNTIFSIKALGVAGDCSFWRTRLRDEAYQVAGGEGILRIDARVRNHLFEKPSHIMLDSNRLRLNFADFHASGSGRLHLLREQRSRVLLRLDKAIIKDRRDNYFYKDCAMHLRLNPSHLRLNGTGLAPKSTQGVVTMWRTIANLKSFNHKLALSSLPFFDCGQIKHFTRLAFQGNRLNRQSWLKGSGKANLHAKHLDMPVKLSIAANIGGADLATSTLWLRKMNILLHDGRLMDGRGKPLAQEDKWRMKLLLSNGFLRHEHAAYHAGFDLTLVTNDLHTLKAMITGERQVQTPALPARLHGRLELRNGLAGAVFPAKDNPKAPVYGKIILGWAGNRWELQAR